MSKSINPHLWLREVTTARNEVELIKILQSNEIREYLLYPRSDGFDPGNFEIISIKDLQIGSHSQSHIRQDGEIPLFSIYYRGPENRGSLHPNRFLDTSSLQTLLNPELLDRAYHNPAVLGENPIKDFNTKDRPAILFQVASNFNCQENGSHLTNLSNGHYLTGLMTDFTQGPSASAGGGLGAIERLKYHLRTPINLLSNLESAGIKIVNGKLLGSTKGFELNNMSIDEVKIGIHRGLTANFDRSFPPSTSNNEDTICTFYPDARRIDQVFVSTVALPKHQKEDVKYPLYWPKTPRTSRAEKRELSLSKSERELASFLLDAAYQGTYLAAATHGTEYMVLTLIGGGVFSNPFELIIRSMAHAHREIGSKSRIREVILPLFDITHNPEFIQKIFEEEGVPKNSIRLIELN